MTELFVGASRSTAVVALVVAGALLVNYVVAAEQIPNEIGAWIQSLHVSRFGFLLIINLMFLVLGCFLDTLLMLLVIVPIVMPSITRARHRQGAFRRDDHRQSDDRHDHPAL